MDGGSSRREGFVGRARELGLLAGELNQAEAGSPRVLLIEGSPGVGKTSLLRRFLTDFEDPRVLRASGDEAETRLPYGVVDQLLRHPTVAIQGDEIHRADASPADDPLVVGAQLLQVIGELGASGPLAVVIEDAHWSDPPSLQAVAFALRRLHADPVLAVLVAREDASILPEGLRRLVADKGLRLHLDGLKVEELADLTRLVTGRNLSRRALERLRDHTGGNPLHVEALLQELDPAVLERLDAPLPAPRSFAMAVVSRLATRSAAARAMVQAASVLRTPCPACVAFHVADVRDPAQALEEASGLGILEVQDTPTGPAVVFCHPLVRAAVFHDMGPARRRELHARAAAVSDGAARLDHRIAATLVTDAALAAEVERHARREAANGAVVSAAGYFVTAARLTFEPSARERLLLDALEQLLLGGEVAEATRLVHDVEALPDSTRRRYLLGHLAFLNGRRREAEMALIDAWERCQTSGDDELGALVSLLLAQLCSTELRVAEAVAWSERVTGVVGARLAAPALGVLVPCLGAAGRADEGLELAASLPDASYPLALHDIEGVLGRGLVRMWVDDLAGACADLSAVVSATRCRPAAPSRLIALGFLAEAEYRLGAWDDSVVHGDLAVSLVEDSDQLWLTAFVRAGATWAMAARGNWDVAARHVEAAWAAASRFGDATSITCAATARVQLAFAKADPEEVLEAVQPLLDLDARTPLAEPSVHPWREVYADALVSLGRLDEAEEALRPLEAQAGARERQSSLAHAARVRGGLEAARRNPDRARASFETALAHCSGVAAPFEHALVKMAYGRFLRRAGERRAGSDHLEGAHDTFCQLGAEPFAERCRADLDACGLSPRRRTPTADRFALSPQELAVAKLVIGGATNREVATQLVVSVKTVEYHLGNLFAKLGINSRRQLRARLSGSDVSG